MLITTALKIGFYNHPENVYVSHFPNNNIYILIVYIIYIFVYIHVVNIVYR